MRKLLLIKKVAILSFIAFLLSVSVYAQQTHLIYVLDAARTLNSPDEVNADLLAETPTLQLFIDDGYIIDTMLIFDISDGTETTASNIEALNGADLVYIGRAVGSTNFDATMTTGDKSRATLWNEITAPIMTGNMWALRSHRMKWFETEAITSNNAAGDAILQATILEPDDEVFDGLEEEFGVDLSGPVDWWNGNYDVISVGAGNGLLLATATDLPIFVRFEEGTEFYAGSGEIPAGERVSFGLDNDNSSTIQYYSRYTDVAKEVFLREAARLSGHIRPGSVGIVNNGYITSKVYIDQSTKQLTVEMDNLRKIDVIDITGRQIYSLSANSDKLTIDLSFATSGIYIVKSTNSNNQFTINKTIKR